MYGDTQNNSLTPDKELPNILVYFFIYVTLNCIIVFIREL